MNKTTLLLLVILGLGRATLQAASDADVTLIKVRSVRITEDAITIVAEANTRLTLIQDNRNPAYKGATWKGRAVTLAHVKSDRGTFIIKQPLEEPLQEAWQTSLRAARDLQDGKEVGRIGYYAPDMTIRDNLLDSVNGFGFLYPKGK